MGAKKFDLNSIEALDIHYVPQKLELVPGYNSIKQEHIPAALIDDPQSTAGSVIGDMFALSLKGFIAYQTMGLSLLRDVKKISMTIMELRRGDFKAVGRRAFKATHAKSKMSKIKSLIYYQMNEQAIKEIRIVKGELEATDEAKFQSYLESLQATLYLKDGHYRNAYECFMRAAIIISSAEQKVIEVEEEKAYTSLKAYNYLCAIKCLVSHVEKHGPIKDDEHSFSELAYKANLFFENEAKYHKNDKYKFKKCGSIQLGSKSLPLYGFAEDNSSEGYNNKLLTEIDKLKRVFQGINDKSFMLKYIGEENYKTDNLESMLKIAEDLIGIENQDESEKIIRFYNFFDEKIQMSDFPKELKLKANLLKIATLIKHNESSENDLLKIFKYLDEHQENEELFLEIFLVADKLSMSWNLKQRQQFAKVMLSKDYTFVDLHYTQTYNKIIDPTFKVNDPVLEIFYPKNFHSFEKALNNLKIKEYRVTYKGTGIILPYEDFRLFALQRAKKFFPEADLAHYEHLNLPSIKENNKPENLSELNLILDKVTQELGLHSKLDYLQERISNNNPRIGVFGLTKTGKSTFLNALFKKEFLKCDRGVATNVITIIKVANEDKALVEFYSGKTKAVPLSEVHLYTSEQENPHNTKEVIKVDICIKSELPQGLEILDIPGFGAETSQFKLHQDVVKKALSLVDGIFFITTPDDSLKSYELDFIKMAKYEFKLPIFVLANKTDKFDSDNEVEAYKNGISKKLESIEAQDVNIVGFSAQLGLAAIEEVNPDKLFGWTKEEAIEDCNMNEILNITQDFYALVKDEQKTNILTKIGEEIENFKTERQNTIKKIEGLTKDGIGELDQDILKINSTKSKLNHYLSHSFQESINDQIMDIEKLTPNSISKGIHVDNSISTFTDIEDDIKAIEAECERVFRKDTADQIDQLERKSKEFFKHIDLCCEELTDYLPGILTQDFENKLTIHNSNDFSFLCKSTHLIIKIFDQKGTIRDIANDFILQLKEVEIYYWNTKKENYNSIYIDLLNQIETKISEFEQIKLAKDSDRAKSIKYNLNMITKAQELISLIKDVK